MEVEISVKQKCYDALCRLVEEQKRATGKALAEERQVGVDVAADHGCAVPVSIHDQGVCVPTADRLLRCVPASVVEAGAQELEVHNYSASSRLNMATSARCSMVCSNESTGLFLCTELPEAATMATSSTAAVSLAYNSISTASSDTAYKLFDRIPRHFEWSSDCALSIMVCSALYPVDEDMLQPILAPYGVKRLVVNPRATTAMGSQYVTAIVELNSADAAVRARVALHGKCLREGCCYLDVRFALPYELTPTSTSSSAARITAPTACVMPEGVSHIEVPTSEPPVMAHVIAVPATTASPVYPSTNTVSTTSAASMLQQCCSELCDEQPSTETCETPKAEMVSSLSQVAAIDITATMPLTPTDSSLQAADGYTVFSTTLTAISACGDAIDTDDTFDEEVFLDVEDMFPPSTLPSEVSTPQPLELFSDRSLCAFVQWPPPLVYQTTSWTDSQTTHQVWTVLRNNLNGGLFLHLWDPGIELLHGDELGSVGTSVEHSVDKVMEIAPLAVACELHHSSSVVENVLDAPYFSWCMRYVKLAIRTIQECLPYLQLQPLISSATEIGSNVRAVPEPLLMTDNTFQWNPNCFVAWYSWYSTLIHAKKLLGEDACSLTWQNNTNLQNPCWNGWSALLLLICGFLVPFLRWIWALLSAVQEYTNSSSRAVLAVMSEISDLCPKGLISWSCAILKSLCDFELVHWKIAWPHFLECSASGNKSDQPFVPTAVRYDGQFDKRTALAPFSARTMQSSLQVIWPQSYHTGNYGSHSLIPSMASTGAFHFASIANWGSCGMSCGQVRLLWYMGIWMLLCFYGFFAQAAAQVGILVEASTYCCRHYFDLFDPVQVHVLDAAIGVSWDCTPLSPSHLTWDPGGYTQHRLEGKPNLKEGGLSATHSILSLGWTVDCQLLGFGPLGSDGRKQLQIGKGATTTKAAWNRKASAWLSLSYSLSLSVAIASSSSISRSPTYEL